MSKDFGILNSQVSSDMLVSDSCVSLQNSFFRYKKEIGNSLTQKNMRTLYRLLESRRTVKAALFIMMTMAVLPGRCGDQPSVDRRFAAADTLFLERADCGKARESLVLYRGFFRENPDCAEGAWRLSMACYFVGFNLAKEPGEKKALFAEGRDAGLYALQRTTVSAEAYFWTAVNMALYGESVGVVKMLFTLSTVRRYLQQSQAIDPSYAYGGASRILGKIDESLPGILGGSKSRAEDQYRKAIAAAPDEPLNYLFLARLLSAGNKNSEEARAVARQGASLAVNEAFRYESIEGLKELRQFAALQEQSAKKMGEK